MNPTEDFRTAPNTSEHFGSLPQIAEGFRDVHNASMHAIGQGRGKKYPGAEVPNPDLERADFLIVEEAYALFESQGERRSVRMIGEYCKTGELICTYDTDDKRWHITKESVENKITKIKALNARKAAVAPQHTSEPFTEPLAAPQRPAEEIRSDREAIPPSPDKIKDLEQEIFDLKVLNKSKDLYITQLIEDREKEREQLLARIESSNRLVGRFKNRLFQLMAPRTARDVDALPPSSGVPSPPTSHTSPDASLLANTPNQYEHPPQEPPTAEQI